MKKRFRDENEKLTKSISEIKEITKKEATEYYNVGSIYEYQNDLDEYVLIEKNAEVAHFHSFSGKHLFIPVDSLGTFLPDVASYGDELIFIE